VVLFTYSTSRCTSSTRSLAFLFSYLGTSV
jgi:hypothetical protein